MKAILALAALVALGAGALALPSATRAQAPAPDWPDMSEAHSLSLPSGPPPAKGYEPYVGAVNEKSEQVIGGVPGYLWRHGCGPTAAGMVMGYYDGQGFGALIPGAATTQTNDVDQAIATGNGAATHYDDYSLPMDASGPILADRSEAPAGDEHPNDCLGDFMRTSWSVDSMRYGWSIMGNVDNAMVDYVDWVNATYGAHYVATAHNEAWGDLTWDDLKAEIAANRPMVFLVDSDGDGGTDHFVTIIGWRDTGGVNEYACLDTWAPVNSVRWERFRAMSSSYGWGIYGGTYFSIASLNNPPVADAGMDVTVECTGGGAADVMLDGTASHDPDGDPLTYAWTAGGISFDDPGSATPTASFPLGTTIVTLTVSDGTDEATATVEVTVVDTTPPVVSCPSDITVECSAAGGVPKDDPQLTAFFAAFSAEDVCCAVAIENDAPDVFPGPCEPGGGVTIVTWTATDCVGNTARCSATVTVVDTTPPEFDVCLPSRDVLWPPNHKMVDIVMTIEVSDVCDADPTVTLISAVSSQPENDLGDGNTEGDIQGCAYGTDDREFSLRSERQGGDKSGRLYTLTYRVADCSGNSTLQDVCIRVPHSQSVIAKGVYGFTPEGTGIARLCRSVQVAVCSATDTDHPQVFSEASGNVARSDFPVFMPEHIMLGNGYDVIRPASHEVVDIDGDGLSDLVLDFRLADLLPLLATVGEYGDLGIQLRTAALGGDHLVKDIFSLGPPLMETGYQHVEAAAPSGDGPLAVSPNPFNPQTTFSFDLRESGRVRLDIYGLRGDLVRRLVDDDLAAGHHDLVWDGRTSSGARAPSGRYLVRFERAGRSETAKILLLK